MNGRRSIVKRTLLAFRATIVCQLCIGHPLDVLLWKQMRVFRQLGVLVLMLVSFLAPAMACMVPDAQLTSQERACCRSMQGPCGETSMPASKGCCQKNLSGVYDRAFDTSAAAFRPVAAIAVWLTASKLLRPVPICAGPIEHTDFSPPKAPPLTVSILRI